MKNNKFRKITASILVSQLMLSTVPMTVLADEQVEIQGSKIEAKGSLENKEEPVENKEEPVENKEEPVENKEEPVVNKDDLEDTLSSEELPEIDVTTEDSNTSLRSRAVIQSSIVYRTPQNPVEIFNATPGSPYIFSLSLDSNNIFVHDMTKHLRGYGASITWPNGGQDRAFKNVAAGQPYFMRIDTTNRRLRKGNIITVSDLNKLGSPIHRSTTIVINQDRYYEDDRVIGQIVYDLFTTYAYNQLQPGVTNVQINNAAARLGQMHPSAEKQRLLGLVNRAYGLIEKNNTIGPTTLNEITNEMTIVSGTAEPNSTININREGSSIGTGRVGSDGKYTITIPKQNVGATITAQATLNGITSNIVAVTVSRAGINETVLDNMNTSSTSAVGVAEPNAMIEVKVDNVTLASGRVGSDGIFVLTVPKQSAGTVVTAQATLNGIKSNIDSIIVERDFIEQVTINEITSVSRVVSGEGEPNSEIQVFNGEKILATGRIGSDGLYSLTIEPQTAGSEVTVVSKKDELVSEASVIVLKANESLVAPVLNTKFVDDAHVSGTVGGTAEFVAVYANGIRLRTASVNADRKFTIYTGDHNLIAGQIIQVAAVTRNGANGPVVEEGPKTDLRIQDRFAAPVINTVHNNDKTVTGTIGGTARFASVYIEGKLVQTTAVNANRTFSIDVSDHALVVGQTVQVAGVTRDGGTGPIIAEGIKSSTIIINRDQLVAPVINPVFVGDAFVRGTVSGTAQFVAIYGTNGQFLRTAAVAADRSFQIYVGDHSLVAGKSIQVSAVTRENNNGPINAEGPRTSERVQDRLVAPTVNPVHVGDAFVNGTIGGTAQFVGLYINGVFIRTAAVNSNRTYTIYVGDRSLVAGQNIQIAGVTRDGSAGPVIATGPMTTSTVLNSGQIVTPPTINSFTEGEQFVTGTADRNGTHVGVYVNGEIRRAAVINPDGTYSIYVGDLNLAAGDKFEIATIIRTSTGLITETGPKKEATVLAKAMTINRYVLRQDTITGTVSSVTARVFLEVDGVQIRRGEVEANGNFAVWARDAITSVGQKVEIVVVGANGVEIGRSLVTVHAS